MKQLRQKFDPIRKGLEKGESYLLMYRSKPLGIMRPYAPDTDAQYLNAGEVIPALPTVKVPQTLPSPQTVSFGSKFKQDARIPSPKPLDRLGMRKVFL